MFKCVIITLFFTSAWARTAPTYQNAIHEEPRAQESSYLGELRYVYKVYQECAAKDLGPCLKLKLIAAMDRVAKSFAEVPIFDGVSFVKDPKTQTLNEIRTEEEIEASLPRSLDERETALNGIIADKITNFMDTHTLQVKLPSATDIQRSFSEEGRKKKQRGGLLLIPLILGGTLVPLALGALALLAGKALIVSKLALVLASIIGLKKLLSGGSHGHDSGHEVVVSGGGHGSSWGRSYEKDQAQELAYSAYAPNKEA